MRKDETIIKEWQYNKASEYPDNIYYNPSEHTFKRIYVEDIVSYVQGDSTCRFVCNDGFEFILDSSPIRSHKVEFIKKTVDSMRGTHKETFAEDYEIYRWLYPPKSKEEDYIEYASEDKWDELYASKFSLGERMKVKKVEGKRICVNDIVDFQTRETYTRFFLKNGSVIRLSNFSFRQGEGDIKSLKRKINKGKTWTEGIKEWFPAFIALATIVAIIVCVLYACSALGDLGGSSDWRDNANDAGYYEGTDGKWYYKGDGVN